MARQISSASGSTDAEWCIVLTDDAEVSQLNETFLGKSGTTDVLSFPLESWSEADGEATEALGGGFVVVPGAPRLQLGDVVISLDQAERQAPDGDLLAEIARLIVHGYCHLRGHDHLVARQKARMRAEERRLLTAIGVSEGLIDRVTPQTRREGGAR